MSALLLTTITAYSNNINIPPQFGEDFHQSMKTWSGYEIDKARPHHTVQCAEKLYNRYAQNLWWHEETLIPEIIHHVWLGKKLPNKESILFDQWIETHPDWFHVLWVDNPINYNLGSKIVSSYQELEQELNSNKNRGQIIIVDVRGIELENQKAFDRGANYGEKSDILRYEILFNIGGLYVDTDFQPVKRFDIFHHTCKFYTGMSNIAPHFDIFIGLIGSSPRHSFLKLCIKRIKDDSTPKKDTMHKTGPYFFTQCIEDYAINPWRSSNDLVVFPAGYFYPWPFKFRHQKKLEQIIEWIQPETYGIHHWHVSWLNTRGNI